MTAMKPTAPADSSIPLLMVDMCEPYERLGVVQLLRDACNSKASGIVGLHATSSTHTHPGAHVRDVGGKAPAS